MKAPDQPLSGRVPEGSAKSSTSLTAHILPTSATMIGVCVAVLSIGQLGTSGKLHVIIDRLLSMDALMFLTSAVLSFVSMRSAGSTVRIEARAEMIFIAGLCVLALGTVVLSFNIN
jgi:hypothetical protein